MHHNQTRIRPQGVVELGLGEAVECPSQSDEDAPEMKDIPLSQHFVRMLPRPAGAVARSCLYKRKIKDNC